MGGLLDLFGRFGGTQPAPTRLADTTPQTVSVYGPWAEGLTRDVPVTDPSAAGYPGYRPPGVLGGGGGRDRGVLGAEAPGGGAIDWTQIQGIDPVLGAGLNRMQASLLEREGGTAQQLGLISKVPVLRDILGTVLDVYGTAQAARRGALGTQRALGKLGAAAQVQAFPQFALGAQRLAAIPREERQLQEAQRLAELATTSEIESRNLRTYWQNEVDKAQKATQEAATDAQRALAQQRLAAAKENLAQAETAGQLKTLPPGFTPTPENVRVIGGKTFIVGPGGRTVPLEGTTGGAKTPPMGAMSPEDAQRKADEIERGGDKAVVRQLQGYPGLYTVDTIQRDVLAPERQSKAIEELQNAAPTVVGGIRVPGTGTNFNDALSRQQLKSGLQRALGYEVDPQEVLSPEGYLDLAKLNHLVTKSRVKRTMMGFD
jgi:hypothetical protein